MLRSKIFFVLATVNLVLMYQNSFVALADTVSSENLYEDAQKQLTVPTDLYPTISEVIKSGWREDEKLTNLLQNNQKAIDLFKQAAQVENKGDLFGQEPKEWRLETSLPRMFGYYDLVELTLLQARQYESKGQYPLAEENYLASIKFLKQLAQQKTFMMLMMLHEAIIFNSYLYSPLVNIVSKEIYNKEAVQALLKELLTVPVGREQFKAAYQNELIRDKKILLQNLQAAEEKENLKDELSAEVKSAIEKKNEDIMKAIDEDDIEKLNQKLKTARENTENILKSVNLTINDLEKPLSDKMWSGKIKTEDIVAYYQQILSLQKKGLSKEDLVNIIVNRDSPRNFKLKDNYNMFLSKFSNLLTALAVKSYQLDHKKQLPNTLDELVPGYLAKIPEDPFSKSQPLKYVKKDQSYRIYSVGPDKVDQSGDVAVTEDDSGGCSDKCSGDSVFSYSAN